VDRGRPPWNLASGSIPGAFAFSGVRPMDHRRGMIALSHSLSGVKSGMALLGVIFARKRRESFSRGGRRG